METTVIYQFSFNKYESTRSSQDEFILKHPYKFIHCIVAFNDEFNNEFSDEFNDEVNDEFKNEVNDEVTDDSMMNSFKDITDEFIERYY